MKCLITGIDGFAGKYLAKYLLSKNAEIFGTILHSDHLSNLSDIKNDISCHVCDIKNKNQIKELLASVSPDKIFHLAAQASPYLSWNNLSETFTVNTIGTIYLLETMLELSLNETKILMVCSGDEYGRNASTITEETPLSPSNPYAISKTAVDWISQQWYSKFGWHIIRVRPFNHSGPGQSSTYVISDFAKQIASIEKKKKAPIIEVGNLDTYKNFTDVRDVVEAYALLLEKGMPGEAYNLASGKNYQIRTILERLITLSDKKITIKIDEKKFRKGNTNIPSIDTTKIKKITGWEPKIEIDQTLKDTLNWWRAKF